MKRAVPAFFLFLLLLLLWLAAGCQPNYGYGYGNYFPTAGTVSNLPKRALVSDSADGSLHIIDATLDLDSLFKISSGSQPGKILLSPNGKLTLAFNAGSNSISVIDNTSEVANGVISLPDFCNSFVMLPDNTTVYATVRNQNLVDVLSTTSLTISSSISVPLPRRLVLSHSGGKILVFSDNTDSMFVIDTASNTVSPPITGFSRPVFGVFSNDDSTAYVLSCGPECGGSQAMVTPLDMTASPPAPGTPVNVAAATVGVIDGNTLYVAGTGPTPGVLAGKLSVLGLSPLSPPATVVPISDGYHELMQVVSNGRIYIGARLCTNQTSQPNSGCLTIFRESDSSALVDNASGDVTGIAPILNRDVVYVVEGGELRILSTTTDAPTTTQIDIVGAAVDVVDIN